MATTVICSQPMLDLLAFLKAPHLPCVILGLGRLGVNLGRPVSVNGSLFPAPAGFILVL